MRLFVAEQLMPHGMRQQLEHAMGIVWLTYGRS